MESQLQSASIEQFDLSSAEYGAIFGYQRDIFELIALDRNEHDILARLCKMAEQIVSDAVASIMMLDPEDGRLYVLQAPSIPQEAIEALNGLTPGPDAGSCGNAMHQQKPQYVSSIRTDQRWDAVRGFAERFGLGACWSMPIQSASGEIVGSFALSSFEEREPKPLHKAIMEFSAYMVTVLLKKRSLQSELTQLNRDLEQKVAERTQALADADAAKNRFLANMSHEIRTPMNAIMGLAHLSLQDKTLSAQLKDYLIKIQNSSRSLLGVINDVLDFSKIEAGELAIETIPFDLNEQLEQLADIMLFKAVEKGVEVIFDVVEGTPTRLVGDPTRLRQVLLNLLSNAVKFTDQGEVILRIWSEQNGAVTVLHGMVEDSGIGIPEPQMERLFDSFYQADLSTSRKYGGTGLGLSISQQLVERMGGEITVESQEGEGARFTFFVQLQIDSISTVEPQEPFGLSLQEGKVLVVDRHPKVQEILGRMLNRMGAEVEMASSVEAALQQLRHSSYRLLLIDAMLQDQAGESLIEQLVSLDSSRLPPILLLCSVCERKRVEQIISHHAAAIAGWLNKPVTFQRLYAALSTLLEGQQEHSNEADVAAPIRLHGMRLLVVDDNLVNQQVATEILRHVGAEVDVASNGVEAVAAVEQDSNYSAILMDLQMPKMDGFEATARIRAHLGGRPLPIIAMTADVMPDELRWVLMIFSTSPLMSIVSTSVCLGVTRFYRWRVFLQWYPHGRNPCQVWIWRRELHACWASPNSIWKFCNHLWI